VLLAFQPYYLPTWDTTVNQLSLPMGYSCLGREPDPARSCDLCANNDNFGVEILNCGHSFHAICQNDVEGCPICIEMITKKISDHANTFNRGLIAKREEAEEDDDEGDADDNDDDDMDDPSRQAEYYHSENFRGNLLERFHSRCREE